MVPEGDFASTPISTCRPDYSLILAKRAFTLPDPHDAEGPHHVVIFILEDVAVEHVATGERRICSASWISIRQRNYNIQEDDNKPAPLWKKARPSGTREPIS